jgi:hypothetical protein
LIDRISQMFDLEFFAPQGAANQLPQPRLENGFAPRRLSGRDPSCDTRYLSHFSPPFRTQTLQHADCQNP